MILVPTAVLTGLLALLLSSIWEKRMGHTTTMLRLGAVFVPGTIASLVYFMMAFAANVPAAREMLHLALTKHRR